MSESIPVVILHGTPFERGRQHGLRFRGEIANAIAAARAAHDQLAYESSARRGRCHLAGD